MNQLKKELMITPTGSTEREEDKVSPLNEEEKVSPFEPPQPEEI